MPEVYIRLRNKKGRLAPPLVQIALLAALPCPADPRGGGQTSVDIYFTFGANSPLV
jgi:hypothetical protein